MKVTLIDYTGCGHHDVLHAARILVFTKNTRLTMDEAQLTAIQMMSKAQILKELEYMANTIPSSWEFVDYTFAVEGVTRAYTHQQVRTRTASYAQQSMRVNDMGYFQYRVPPRLSPPTPDKKDNVDWKQQERYNIYARTMDYINRNYGSLISMGVAEEDARGILPTNILTNIVCKFNLRVLADLVKSREGGRTQDEYRDVVRLMGDEVLRVHPWASLFLYPKGRDYWKELEDAIEALVPNMKIRAPVMKIIDKMRKS